MQLVAVLAFAMRYVLQPGGGTPGAPGAPSYQGMGAYGGGVGDGGLGGGGLAGGGLAGGGVDGGGVDGGGVDGGGGPGDSGLGAAAGYAGDDVGLRPRCDLNQSAHGAAPHDDGGATDAHEYDVPAAAEAAEAAAPTALAARALEEEQTAPPPYQSSCRRRVPATAEPVPDRDIGTESLAYLQQN